MSKKKLPQPPKTEGELLADALFGSGEDLDEERAREHLRAFGIDPEQLVVGFKESVKEELKRIHDETSEVSAPLSATLKSINAYLRDDEPAPVDPGDWVTNLLAGTLPAAAGAQAVASFRNCAEGKVSSKDKSIIDALKAELVGAEE